MTTMKNRLKKIAPYLAVFAAGAGTALVLIQQNKTPNINVNNDLDDGLYRIDEDQMLLLSGLLYANEGDQALVYKNGNIWVPDSVTMHNADHDDISL